MDDALETYKKVLELNPRHAVALGFLGMVYHLKGDLDEAIVKYHEVRPLPSLPIKHTVNTVSQSLSVEPANPHILEVLNMAIESVTSKVQGQASSDAEFRQAIKELKDTYLKMGVKFKGKERALLGIGLPRAAPTNAAGGGGAGSSAEDRGGGPNIEVEGDEMNLG